MFMFKSMSMSKHAMLCYAIPCYAMLCYAVLWCVVMCVLYDYILFDYMLANPMLICSGLNCCALFWSIMLFILCSFLFCAVLFYSVLAYHKHFVKSGSRRLMARLLDCSVAECAQFWICQQWDMLAPGWMNVKIARLFAVPEYFVYHCYPMHAVVQWWRLSFPAVPWCALIRTGVDQYWRIPGCLDQKIGKKSRLTDWPDWLRVFMFVDVMPHCFEIQIGWTCVCVCVWVARLMHNLDWSDWDADCTLPIGCTILLSDQLLFSLQL